MQTLIRRRGRTYCEETLYPSYHKSDTPERRREKSAIRSRANRAKNDRYQWQRALLLLDYNFTRGATVLTLTFSDTWLPKDDEEANRRVAAFRRRLRTRAKKRGEAPPKIVWAVENVHGEGRFHIHMVTDIPDWQREEVLALWDYGDYTCQEMQEVELNVNGNPAWIGIARYLTKEGKHRGVGKYLLHKTRNVIMPPETSEQVEDTYTLKDHLPAGAFIEEYSSFERPMGAGRYESAFYYTLPDNSSFERPTGASAHRAKTGKTAAGRIDVNACAPPDNST